MGMGLEQNLGYRNEHVEHGNRTGSNEGER